MISRKLQNIIPISECYHNERVVDHLPLMTYGLKKFDTRSEHGSVALKFKKKFTFWSVNFFCLNCLIHRENQSKNFYILKCKIWNVRVKQHNPTSLWQGPRKCREEVWLCAFLRLVILYPDISNFTLWNVKNLKCNFFWFILPMN